MGRRRESELEGFVLGLLWQFGPCSAYEIRRLLLGSPSTQWSGSAGAVYPLLRRLTRGGCLSARHGRTGKRPRAEYTITPRGLAALKRWIGPPLAPVAITVPHDPLRSRARFLALLGAADRRKWIAAARAALDAVEERVAEWDSRFAGNGDPYLTAMTTQAEADLATRRRWLGRLQSSHGQPKGRRHRKQSDN